MLWDDVAKLATGRTLYRLDSLIGARLVPAFYALGLAAIVLWGIDHLVESFALSFAQGLWSVVEIVVVAPLALIVLRLLAEMMLVFFKAHETAVAAVQVTRPQSSLGDEVSAAIHELAEDDPTPPASPPLSTDDD